MFSFLVVMISLRLADENMPFMFAPCLCLNILFFIELEDAKYELNIIAMIVHLLYGLQW